MAEDQFDFLQYLQPQDAQDTSVQSGIDLNQQPPDQVDQFDFTQHLDSKDFNFLPEVPGSVAAKAKEHLKALQPPDLKGLQGFLTPPKEEPTGLISRLFDATDRIRYAVAKYQTMDAEDAKKSLGLSLETAMARSLGPLGGLADAAVKQFIDPREREKVTEGLSELINPVERKSMIDVIRTTAPDLADRFPTATATLGWIADQTLNPLSYATAGPKSSAAKIIEKNGERYLLNPKGAMTLTGIVENFLKDVSGFSRDHDVQAISSLSKAYKAMAPSAQEKLGGFAPKLAGLLEQFDKEVEQRLINRTVREGDKFLVKAIDMPTMINTGQKMAPRSPLNRFVRGVTDKYYEFNSFEEAKAAMDQAAMFDIKAELQPKYWETLISNIKGDLNKPEVKYLLEVNKIKPPLPFDPEIAGEDKMIEFLKSGAEGLTQKGGLYLGGVNVVPERIARLTGIPQLEDALGSLASYAGKVTGLSTVFKRWYDIPSKVVEQFKGYFGRTGRLQEDTLRLVQRMEGANLSKEDLLHVNRVGQDISDKTWGRYQELINSGLRHSQVMTKLREEGPKIAEDMLDQLLPHGVGTNTEKRALYATARSHFEQIRKEMQAVSILRDSWVNYWPAIYDMAKDPNEIIRLQRSPLAGRFVSAAQAKMIKTFEEARRYGIDTDISVLELLANRTYEARMAVQDKLLRNSLKTMYGVDTMVGLQRAAPKVIKQLAFIGEGDYGSGLSNDAQLALKVYDRVLNAFRFSATVLRPAFAIKQAVSNTLQSVAAAGFDALGMFNPHSIHDVSMLLAYHHGLLSEKQIAKLGEKEMITSLGIRKSWTKWYEEMMNNGVITGMDLRGGTQAPTAKRVQQAIAAELDRAKRLKDFGPQGEKWDQLKQAFATLGNFTNYPSMVEDWFRSALYLNARRGGYSEVAARELVTSALFDYGHGLSQTARRFVRRVYPFISYQNFVIPLIKETFLTRPNVAFNINKAGEDFLKGWNLYNGGQQIPENIRTALPGWLMDKPFVYWDKYRMATFGNLRSFNPMDMLEGMQTNADGSIDEVGTLRKVFLGSMAPMIKAPLQALTGKNFFTNDDLFKAASGDDPFVQFGGRQVQKKKIGEVTPDGILSNIIAALGAASAPGPLKIPATLVGKATGEVTPAEAIDWFKGISGWEERWNKDTGRTDVYVNPYLLYWATENIPIMNQIIRYDRQYDTPKEKWLELIGGIGTIKRDLNKDIFQNQKREVRKAQTDLTQLRKGNYSPDDADKRAQELKDYLDLIRHKYGSIDYSQIPTPLRPDAQNPDDPFDFSGAWEK